MQNKSLLPLTYPVARLASTRKPAHGVVHDF